MKESRGKGRGKGLPGVQQKVAARQGTEAGTGGASGS